MRNIITIAIFSLMMINCKGQEKKDTITIKNFKKDTMEYFHENRYNDWKLDKENSNINHKRYIKDKNWVTIYFGKEGYTEQIQQIDSPYEEYKYYHKNTLLKAKVVRFYGFPIGHNKEYDEYGKLINEINYDEPYKFSVGDLIAKIQHEFGIGLVNDYRSSEAVNFYVTRWTGYTSKFLYYQTNVPFYQVKFLNKKNEWIYLEISGIDGSIITEQVNGKYLIPKGYNPEQKGNPNEKNKSFSFLASPEEKGDYQKPELGAIYTEGSKVPEGTYQIYEGRAYTKAEWEAFHKSLPWWKRIM
ncbi:hypothetical protein [Chryseobacterium ginsengisoli]